LLERRDLRLRGKADRITRLGPREFEIRDFKTGAVLDEQGQIKREIVLQLSAYGLLLLHDHPHARVRLIVDDGQDREIAFEEQQQQEAMDELKSILNSFPPPGIASARELAHPGRNCWGCGVRHVCPSYREHAPIWWARYPTSMPRLPNDLWGTALEVVEDLKVHMVMRDDAGRRVRVTGLDLRHRLSRATIGKRVWMFGLEATGPTSSFDGSRFHPRNFHEHPRDRMERRAWALQVFEE
jgi:hypothetical protein